MLHSPFGVLPGYERALCRGRLPVGGALRRASLCVERSAYRSCVLCCGVCEKWIFGLCVGTWTPFVVGGYCGALEFLRVEEVSVDGKCGNKQPTVSLPNTLVLPANAFKLRWFYFFLSYRYSLTRRNAGRIVWRFDNILTYSEPHVE
jgi:hypothetical protein